MIMGHLLENVKKLESDVKFTKIDSNQKHLLSNKGTQFERIN